MKTKSEFQSRGTYWPALVTLLPRTRCIAAVLFVLIAVLMTCYSTVADAGRTDTHEARNEANMLPSEEDESDPEYLETRREFLDRFFGNGPGAISPDAYASSLAAARALPRSPLSQGRQFMSPETLEAVAPWTFPVPPPIRNSYGGNASARVHALAIDPTNANVVYTGSFGGLAKTTDGGMTWRYLSDAWASQSVSSIAINPAASRHLYAGTGTDAHFGAGLYHSSDGGTTWSNLGAIQFTGTVIRAIAIDPRTFRRLTLYVANGLSHTSGLWSSSDGGATWTLLRQAGRAGSGEEYDGIHDLAIDLSTYPSTLYVIEDDGTFKSTDAGHSWTQIRAETVPAGSRLNRLSVVNSVLYLMRASDPDHNFYKSTDRGATWIQISTNCFGGADSCANANNIGFGVFAVDPFNPNVILAGNQALYRTDDEGVTWSEIGNMWGNDPDPARRIHTDQQVIAFSRTGLGVVYDGNDGGIVGSSDAGLHWTNLDQNLPGALTYGVALSADSSMIAGTQDNGAVFSDPLALWGRTWDSIFGGDSAHDLLDPVDGAVGYTTMYGRRSFRRFHRAAPHSNVDISPSQFASDGGCNFFPTFSMNPLYPTHLIAACQQVVRTLNGPTVTPSTWTRIGPSLVNPNLDPHAYGNYVTAAYQAPSNSNVIYAVRGWDTVFVTSNADQGNGAVWNQVTPHNQINGINAVTVDPTDPATAYLACNSGIYKTTDMGVTWTQQGPPSLIYRDVVIDPVNPLHLFAASNAGVFASTNGGATWGNISDGIPTGMIVSGLSFNAVSRQLAASTFGRGVYILNLNVAFTTPGL